MLARRPQTLAVFRALEHRADSWEPIEMPLTAAEARYLDRHYKPMTREERAKWRADTDAAVAWGNRLAARMFLRELAKGRWRARVTW
jgi:hypothetical protein